MSLDFEPTPLPIDTEAASDPGTKAMSLWDHLEELRWVLLKTAIVFVVAGTVIGCSLLAFQGMLNWPLNQAEAITGQTVALRTGGPAEIFSVLFQMVFFGALGLALPAALYFLAQFVAPGLTPKERRMLRPVCWALLGLFFAGAALAFFLVLPMMFVISIQLNQLFGFEELWTPGAYYGSVVSITLALGMVFQFPLVLIVLVQLGILSVAGLREARRYAVVIVLIFAALITPTGDPITLGLVFLPLYSLYEGSILVGQRLRPFNDSDDDLADDEADPR